MANFLDAQEALCLIASIEEMANVLDAKENINDRDSVALINMARQLHGYLPRSLGSSTVDRLVIIDHEDERFLLAPTS